MVQRFPVPWSDALEAHLRHVLDSSRRRLGGEILKRVTFRSGEVHTWTETDQFPSNFAYGGVLVQPGPETWRYAPGSVLKPVPNTRDQLVDEVVEYLRTGTNGCALFTNELVDPGEPGAAADAGTVATLGSDLYHLVLAGASDVHIRDAIDAGHCVPVHYGILSKVSLDGAQFPLELTEAQLAEMIDHLVAVIVGAFDGEGFLVWYIDASRRKRQ